MFGSHDCSREELVAELGAAFLCGTAGIEGANLQDSSAYLASWIKVLRSDSRLVITAAAQAQKIADYTLVREFPRLPSTVLESVLRLSGIYKRATALCCRAAEPPKY
jgi:antirestriction protein ArdC